MLEILAITQGGGKTTHVGQQTFLESTRWTVPQGVYEISIVCVGGGQSALNSSGSGGDLRWMSSFEVKPGQVLNIQAGPTPRPGAGIDSFVALEDGTHILVAKGGASVKLPSTFTNLPLIGGGNGGIPTSLYGGGGAGGYSGSGGNGNSQGNGFAGRGGGGGGGSYYYYNSRDWAGGGGGVGIHGAGESGDGGIYNGPGSTGPGLSGGRAGSVYNSSNIPPSDTAQSGSGPTAGSFGGGSGYFQGSPPEAGRGAVRIIWGPGRAFPDKQTLNM